MNFQEPEKKSKYPHPAKLWPTRWIFHDRSDQTVEEQIMDSLYDIRIMMFVWIVLWIIW